MPRELIVRDPYSGEEIQKLAYAEPEAIRRALDAGARAFAAWRNSPAWERTALLEKVARDLETQKEDFARCISREAGKPITLARAEVDRAVGVFKWAAAEAPRFSGELLRLDAGRTGRAGFGIHSRFPRGLVLGITPFNFPLNLVAHKVAPAIAAGCPILVKPSPSTPMTAQKLASLFGDHPVAGLMQVVLADDDTTEALTRAQEVALISFTGSARVGWMIRRQAPEKPTVLELGGNAWVIVMEDTPESAYPSIARRITGAGFGYAGQSCISVQNVAIAEPAWPAIKRILTESTQTTAFGDPSIADTVCGPVIHAAAAKRILASLSRTPKDWERIHSTSAQTAMAPAAETLLAPTLLIMPEFRDSIVSGPETEGLLQEEIFGPVMTAGSFQKLDTLISRINSSRYGLQAGVYTQSWPVIERLYRELQVGGLVVNDVPTTRYDHQPYGGVKDSGQGREGIRYAMEEMTESKFLALSSEIP